MTTKSFVNRTDTDIFILNEGLSLIRLSATQLAIKMLQI